MTTLRRLEARLHAWKSFRGLAHAARSLAAAQSLRWSARATQAADHLARCQALVAGWSPPPTSRPTLVILAIGTDLGLCGRLNRLVADALVAEVDAARPVEPLVIAVGQRLRIELGDRLADAPTLPSPSSIEAALALAGRLEGLLREVADPRAIDLRLVLAGATSSNGAPQIVTWDAHAPTSGARDLDEGSDEAVPSPPRTSSPAGDDAPPGELADKGASARARRIERPDRRALLCPPERVHGPAAGLLLHARLVHAFAAAAASEADARLQTMSRAVDTSDRRIDEHERLLRKHRQESITQEMLEVLGGRRRVFGPAGSSDLSSKTG